MGIKQTVGNQELAKESLHQSNKHLLKAGLLRLQLLQHCAIDVFEMQVRHSLMRGGGVY